MILGACTYDTHFEDCLVHCTTAVGCPIGLTCEAEGFCRTPGAVETCVAVGGCDYAAGFDAEIVSEDPREGGAVLSWRKSWRKSW